MGVHYLKYSVQFQGFTVQTRSTIVLSYCSKQSNTSEYPFCAVIIIVMTKSAERQDNVLMSYILPSLPVLPCSAFSFHHAPHARLERFGHQTTNATSMPNMLHQRTVTSYCRRGPNVDVSRRIIIALHPWWLNVAQWEVNQMNQLTDKS